MTDPAANPELLRSLGRLVRGLSALFWGLPLSLLASAGTATSTWFPAYGLTPLAATGLLLFGLWQLGSFQKQERPWRAALDRTQLLAWINVGLSPFLYWWSRVSDNLFFYVVVCLFGISMVLFLFNLNGVLLRLGAMLPDEALRAEMRHFTALNRGLLVTLLAIGALYLGPVQSQHLPAPLDANRVWIEWIARWALLLFTLLPLAMTMALVWKTKEVILESVFGVGR